MKKRNIILAFLLTASMVLTACGKKGEKPAEKEQPKTQQETLKAQKKDELVLGFGSEPKGGWDPIKGSGHYGTSIFQSALFKRDINLKIENDLAEAFKVSDDKKVYTITVRKDAKWTDGKPVTAKDVAFTYNKAKEAGTSAVDLSSMVKATAKDDYNVEFVLKQPDVGFFAKMVSLGIVPEHAYSDTYGEKPIGCGPFKFVEWKKNEQLIVEPNPDYHGKKVPFKKITFLFLKPENVVNIAKAGKADVIKIPVTEANTKFEGYKLETLKTIDNRGVAFPYVPNEGKKTNDKTISPNAPIGNNVTSDIAIRKAFDIAIDRQAIIDGALNRHGTKASSIADGLPWYNPETAIKKDGDIEGAKKILEEAGWKEGANGIREKNGLKAEFTLWYAYKDRENIALSFAETGKKIGINVTPKYAEWSEIEPKMYSEPVLFGWGGYDPLEMYYSYSSEYRGNDYYNTNFYSNPVVDEHFKKALTSATEEEAYEHFKKAQWDGKTGLSGLGDAPWVWVVNENHLYLVKEGLEIGPQKIQPHGGGWPMLDTITEWKFK